MGKRHEARRRVRHLLAPAGPRFANDAGLFSARGGCKTWLLIETGIIKGRRGTSYHSIKTDVINAGAKWIDSQVVTDQSVITSRNPGDLDAFSAKVIEELAEGRHKQRSAAA